MYPPVVHACADMCSFNGGVSTLISYQGLYCTRYRLFYRADTAIKIHITKHILCTLDKVGYIRIPHDDVLS